MPPQIKLEPRSQGLWFRSGTVTLSDIILIKATAKNVCFHNS